MSKAKLLGIKEAQGTFEGKPFHSVKLHISEPFVGIGCYGAETSIQSVKYENIPFVFGKPISVQELSTYVNAEMDISYDKNGKVVSISFPSDVYEPAPAKK